MSEARTSAAERLPAAMTRLRSPWQAIDAGFMLARAHYPTLFVLWCALSLPVLVISVVLLHRMPFTPILLWWWLKPLYELPLLLYLSRALFGDVPTRREVLREVPGHMPRLLGTYLTLSRLSPARAMCAPIVLLEGLSGAARRRRRETLMAAPHRAGSLLIAGVHAELLLVFGGLALLAILFPALLSFFDWSDLLDADAFDADGGSAQALGAVELLVTVTGAALVAPFYVAAGFTLYIRRRVELEAWDIEHRFGRIAATHRGRAGARATSEPSDPAPPADGPGGDRRGPAGPAVAAALLCAVVAITAVPERAFAETGPDAIASDAAPGSDDDAFPTPATVRARLDAVLADEEFGGTTTRRMPTLDLDGNGDEDEDEAREWFSDPDPAAWIARLFGGFADTMRVLAWVVIGAAVVLLVVAVRRYAPGIRAALPSRPAAARPDPVHFRALDGAPPADVAGAARERFGAGDARGALSVLYRGSIAALVGDAAIDIPASATEDECLELARAAATPAQARLLERVLGAWRREAWAHAGQSPDALAPLVGEWSIAFDPDVRGPVVAAGDGARR